MKSERGQDRNSDAARRKAMATFAAASREDLQALVAEGWSRLVVDLDSFTFTTAAGVGPIKGLAGKNTTVFDAKGMAERVQKEAAETKELYAR